MMFILIIDSQNTWTTLSLRRTLCAASCRSAWHPLLELRQNCLATKVKLDINNTSVKIGCL